MEKKPEYQAPVMLITVLNRLDVLMYSNRGDDLIDDNDFIGSNYPS